MWNYFEFHGKKGLASAVNPQSDLYMYECMCSRDSSQTTTTNNEQKGGEVSKQGPKRQNSKDAFLEILDGHIVNRDDDRNRKAREDQTRPDQTRAQ